jgi:hypothetical protein
MLKDDTEGMVEDQVVLKTILNPTLSPLYGTHQAPPVFIRMAIGAHMAIGQDGSPYQKYGNARPMWMISEELRQSSQLKSSIGRC